MADDKAPSRALVAGDLEDVVIELLKACDPKTETERLAYGQVFATLALGQRLADLTDKLGDYLGDDSHLDGLKVAVRDGLAR